MAVSIQLVAALGTQAIEEESQTSNRTIFLVMTKFQYYDKGDGIMVVGLDDCMGDWGWIDMSWEEFSGLSDEQKDYLGEQSFM